MQRHGTEGGGGGGLKVAALFPLGFLSWSGVPLYVRTINLGADIKGARKLEQTGTNIKH